MLKYNLKSCIDPCKGEWCRCAANTLDEANDCLVVVLAGSEEKCQDCLKLGVDVVINYHQTSFEQRKQEHVPIGSEIIIDVVGGDYLQRNINVADVDGHIVLLSILQDRYCEQIDLAKMLIKRRTITASTLRNRSDNYKT